MIEISQPPRLTDTFLVSAIVDPRTGEQLSAAEAVQRGILDIEGGTYRDPQTGT